MQVTTYIINGLYYPTSENIAEFAIRFLFAI